jgi:predicted unusual protein kinase regulating ubiquinone biosynthesis (AarF/ABC1/UbiB family)
MDTVAKNLKPIQRRVVIPRSVPGLVTNRMLVMHYLDGVPLTQLGRHTRSLSEAKKRAAMKRVRHQPPPGPDHRSTLCHRLF